MDRRDVWLLLPRPLRNLPADLAAVVLLTAVTLVSVFVPVLNETPLRIVFGLCFVLFLPGYAFVTALFPEAGGRSSSVTVDTTADSAAASSDKPSAVPGTDAAAEAETTAQPPEPDPEGIDGIERVGLSIAIVPLIGLVLNFTPWGIRLVPIVVAVAGFTLISVAVAARRRHALPPTDLFSVPYRTWLTTARAELVEPEGRTDAALNVLLVVSILLAIGSVGYAVAVPQQGEQFSEFYLLTENPDGELVADDYPEQLEQGERAELIVGISNNEYERTAYTVVVQLQEVTQEGNETQVINRQEIDRFTATLDHNTTHHEQHQLQPTRTGENLRVQYLLYDGEPPETPTQETAYRDLHLWVDVVDSSGQ
ncbi:DUF1616 domain-containing protein [Halorubrum sp. BOL3-1]|uniref:DUF1616 domain-containing protein n=1 Tax=Halorubrum sp. BOL3-1 TaxID=2497325 RepID=UPI001004F34C|nr:DUF1616 domain-containing protein [Halorubrum sp. BOL3-1]QAU13477.1 DUF1616 domain-containing protein [Halorubrum sp. BOL3-1]